MPRKKKGRKKSKKTIARPLLRIGQKAGMCVIVDFIKMYSGVKKMPKVNLKHDPEGAVFHQTLMSVMCKWDVKTLDKFYMECTRDICPYNKLEEKLHEMKVLVGEIFETPRHKGDNDSYCHKIEIDTLKMWPGGRMKKGPKKEGGKMARRGFGASSSKKKASKKKSKASKKKISKKKVSKKKKKAASKKKLRGTSKKTGKKAASKKKTASKKKSGGGGARTMLRLEDKIVKTGKGSPKKGAPTEIFEALPRKAITFEEILKIVSKKCKFDGKEKNEKYVRRFISGGLRKGIYAKK